MNTYKFFIISIILFLLIPFVALGKTTHISYLNNFNEFKNQTNEISDKYLIESNSYSNPIYNIATFNINTTFKIQARFSNLNNIEGKSIKIQNTKGKTTKISNPECGLIWNYIDQNNYYLIKINCFNTNLHDIADQRKMAINIIKFTNGKESKLQTIILDDNVNLFDGFNTIQICYKNPITDIYIGDKKLYKITEIYDIEYQNSISSGFYIGSGSMLAIEQFTIHTEHTSKYPNTSKWTKQSIDEYLKNHKTDLIEGLWSYLDKNINEESLKLGGKYTIAIIKNQSGYDLIYYDGAEINNKNWQCGMLKGIIQKTSFQDNYNLIWWDSKKNAIDDDTYSTISDFKILTLYFPTEKSQIRFYKK